jgi:hypothetical protein
MKKIFLHSLMLIVFSLFTFASYAQQSVRGVVQGDDGELLPGVTILVQGTTTGVTTNIDGSYAINVPSAQSILVFSYVGMEQQVIPVDGRSVINVTMTSSAIGLDEVVVTALGISRERKSLGYSVSEVRGENIETVAQENIMNSLSGRVAGCCN